MFERKPPLFVLAAVFFLSSVAAAQPGDRSHAVLIQKVELKSADGQWISIIEPDKLVDLETQEPEISFFNNGRVPRGWYGNFRLSLSQRSGQKLVITSAKDFKPVLVQKGSFVAVWFGVALLPVNQKIENVGLTVDQSTMNLNAADLWIEQS